MVVTIGFTVIVVDVPLPTCVPPQEPVYHFQLALVPKLPSVTVNVDVAPEQIFAEFAVAVVGATDDVLKVTEVFTQEVFPQSPSALT